jgi:hypothetical protein
MSSLRVPPIPYRQLQLQLMAFQRCVSKETYRQYLTANTFLFIFLVFFAFAFNDQE